ncbi:YheC/YheD family protein [Metabacillus litoralis]|uniref:YheC/YheD family endospore coat-associated protein n=1 Tax=Metabacillus litoralis TaxID=152268 RepID=UPI001CFCECF3|nr:YheC/YheD family protein [Metabacillus litoralis]
MQKKTLGFLVINKKHENTYITEIAKRSEPYNIECVRFEPTSIDPTSLMITGEKFEPKAQQWVDTSFSIPSFIYDRCFYNNQQASKKGKPIVEWLKKNPTTTFLGFGLPDKWKLYTSLLNDQTIDPYLPPTELLNDSIQVIKHLKLSGPCILKPIHGSRGVGIIAVKQSSDSITVTYHKGHDKKHKVFSSLKDLSKWCEKLILQQPYLLQPYLPLTDANNYPFDIRLFMQKDRNGEWHLIEKGVRKGYHGSFLSNLNSGGDPLRFQDWSQDLTHKQKYLLEDELSTIIDCLPPLLEEKFKQLFEIGVDIGYAKDGSIWILDINSKPGRKTFTKTNPHLKEQLYKAPLEYCQYLSKYNNVKGVETND